MPGGVAVDLSPAGADVIRDLVAALRRAVPPPVELYENTASLQDRTVGTGIVRPALARQYGSGGYVGRASGAPLRDARAQMGGGGRRLRARRQPVRRGDYAVAGGVAAVIPVDLRIPGCPPTPTAFLKGLLALMARGER